MGTETKELAQWDWNQLNKVKTFETQILSKISSRQNFTYSFILMSDLIKRVFKVYQYSIRYSESRLNKNKIVGYVTCQKTVICTVSLCGCVYVIPRFIIFEENWISKWWFPLNIFVILHKIILKFLFHDFVSSCILNFWSVNKCAKAYNGISDNSEIKFNI